MLKPLKPTKSELTDLENFLQTLHSYHYKMRAPKHLLLELTKVRLWSKILHIN